MTVWTLLQQLPAYKWLIFMTSLSHFFNTSSNFKACASELLGYTSAHGCNRSLTSFTLIGMTILNSLKRGIVVTNSAQLFYYQ